MASNFTKERPMSSIRRALPFVLAALASAPALAAPAAGPHGWCGTHPLNLPVAQARDAAFERHLERQRRAGRLPLKSAPVVFQSGNVAVIEDDGTIAVSPKPFDLDGRSVQFLRRPKGLSAVRSPLDFKDDVGEKLALGDDDAVEIAFPPGFTFPIGDQVYDSLWVNSDGNLTFGAADADSSARSLERFLAGPPRIAALFTDLDPSSAGGVYVSFPPERVRVTWLEVPIFGDNGMVNTFQVTLFTTGRANVAYGDRVDAADAIVGAAPFGTNALHLIDYDVELPFRPPQRLAIAEEFRSTQDVNLAALSRTFYAHFEDVYDYLAVWEDFFIRLLDGSAFAFAARVRNDVRGLGLPLFDAAGGFGSSGRLQTFLQMGFVIRYRPTLGQLINRTYDSMGILAHEAGHRWLSHPRYVEPNGARTNRLIGAGGSHWSHFVDTDGSLMEGNDYEDQGGGNFRITERTSSHFSDVDQYLMGLLPPAQVADFFYIDNPVIFNQDDVTLVDRIGAVVPGTRVDAGIDGIIAAEGPRIPGAAAAPKNFRLAFILLARAGQPASQESIDLLETLRTQFNGYFQDATDNRATMATGLFPK
jgi:hypothetical protein